MVYGTGVLADDKPIVVGRTLRAASGSLRARLSLLS